MFVLLALLLPPLLLDVACVVRLPRGVRALLRPPPAKIASAAAAVSAEFAFPKTGRSKKISSSARPAAAARSLLHAGPF